MNGSRRHRIVRPLIGCLMLVALLSAAVPASAAQPPLYARPTGHTIPAAFRPLWEQTGGADGLGWPLDEVKATAEGQEQWFEYGRIVQKGSNPPELAVVGREAAQFGSVLNLSAFRPLVKASGPDLSNAFYFSNKWGHWTANGFFGIWNNKKTLLGEPISEEFQQNGATVQYFERGRLEIDVTANNAIRITQLGVLAHGPAAPPSIRPKARTRSARRRSGISKASSRTRATGCSSILPSSTSGRSTARPWSRRSMSPPVSPATRRPPAPIR